MHLGWVGPRGTGWGSLMQEEVASLEADAAELLVDERAAEAAIVQERLLAVLRRHLPERAPAARRRLARTLARAGRPSAALAALAEAFPEGDPEDWYEAAVVAVRSGDEVSARRWVEAGLARCTGPESSEVAECLADIGGDLDARAAFLRLRGGLGEDEPDEDGAERVARAIVGPDRSYLVEAMAEEVLGSVAPDDLGAFWRRSAPPAPPAARRAWPSPRSCRPARPAWRGPPPGEPPGPAVPPSAASSRRAPSPPGPRRGPTPPTSSSSCSRSPRSGGAVSPLVVLVDHDQLGGGVKDAFFLPDGAAPRLRRELFAPMDELGLPSAPADLRETIAALRRALAVTAEIGWTLPSLRTQPVLARIDRWLLRPAAAPAAGR